MSRPQYARPEPRPNAIRRLLLVLAFAATGLALAADPSGGGLIQPSGAGEFLAQAPATSITFWRSFAGPSAEAQEEMVARFNASQSAVAVEAVFQGFYLELAQQLMAAIAARRLPDLVTLDTGLAVSFARDGLLQPLDALLDGPDGIGREFFTPGMLEAGQVDGVQYLIPFAISTPVLYYNEEMLADAGIAEPPQTWGELFEQARAIHAHYGDGTFGLSYEIRFWWLQAQIWALGGQISDSDHNTFIDSEIWVEHLTELQDLVLRERAANIPPSAAGGITADLASGRAAMMVTSSAQLANVLNAVGDSFTLGVAPLPGGPAGRMVPLGGSGLVIPAGLPQAQVEAAWDFLSFLVSAESNAYFSSRSGYLPLTTEAAAALEPFLQDNPLWRVPIGQLDYARKNSELHDTRDGQPVVTEVLQQILLRGDDPAIVLPLAQDRLQQALREEGLR